MRLLRIFQDALLAPPDGRLLWRSVLNWLLGFSGAAVAVAAAFGLAVLSGIPVESLKAPPGNGLGAWDFIRVGLLVPALETLVLAGMLLFLPERWSIVSRATVMGVAWGGLHALLAPMWFFGPAFLFFVCSCAYLTWRPVSFRHAFTVAALPHALNNLAVMTWAAITG